MVKVAKTALLWGLMALALLLPSAALGDVDHPTANSETVTPTTETAPETQNVADLLEEAQNLLSAGNPIDARSKMLRAAQLAPTDYRPQILLGSYYLAEVGHFRLALKYLLRAQQLIREQVGADRELATDPEYWKDHARLLYFLAEAQLNLDDYQSSLDTLDRFANYYWDDWYPGSRAWVLMKLKRVDDAIRVSQAGLLRGAEPGRTYNILGILFSLKDNRKLALQAFGKAIRAERAMGPLGQPATPLNNAGEVYREIFQDDLAEASFLQALRLRDGCDHILPSLNLTLLYTDQLRLFQAERVLDDFVSCFAQHSERSDTEHRALLALARGRIALHKGDAVTAEKFLTQAIEREQWFGKIGTNENDVRLATSFTMGEILEFEAATWRDRYPSSIKEALLHKVFATWSELRSRWYYRKAREVALTELNDFEDLHFRNTDTMLEYPTLGQLLKTFPEQSFDARFKRLMSEDLRDGAKPHYELYRAINLINHGERAEGIKLLEKVRSSLREIDRLASSQTLAHLIRAYIDRDTPIWPLNILWGISAEKQQKIDSLLEELFTLTPAYVRHFDLALPVALDGSTSSNSAGDLANSLLKQLSGRRFVERHSALDLKIKSHCEPAPENKDNYSCILTLYKSSKMVASVTKSLEDTQSGRASILNEFVDKVFSHRTDPAPAPLPKLEILEGDAALE